MKYFNLYKGEMHKIKALLLAPQQHRKEYHQNCSILMSALKKAIAIIKVWGWIVDLVV